MSYDLNTDYQDLINQAVAKGDYAAAAKYEEQRNQKIADLDADGTNVYGATQTNRYSQYRDQSAIVPETGLYTKDYDAAKQAADYHGVGVSATTYNGQNGWYKVDRADRTPIPGTSGADEGLMTDAAYAKVQTLKQRYDVQQKLYNDAVAAGDTAAAQAARERMDAIHQQAEDIRAGYGYSGGVDGGDYIIRQEPEEDDGWDDDEDRHPTWSGGSSGPSGGALRPGNSGGTGNTGGIKTDIINTSVPANDIPVPEVGDLTAGVEDYSAYLEQMNAALKQAALDELKAAYDKNVATIERSEAGVADTYQAARNQTAGASEQAKRNFAQYAAASGLNNGTAGQAELARSIALQGDLNTINAGEANTLADLELQRANAEIEYNSAIAQAQAAGDYQLAADLYEEKVRVQQALTEAQIQQHKFALQQYQLQYQARQDQFDNQLSADKFTWQQMQQAVENQLAQDKLTWQQQQDAIANQLAQDKWNYQTQQDAIANQLAQDKLDQSRQDAIANQAKEQNAALAEAGWKYLAKGAMPTAAMLTAMGLTQSDAQRYIDALAK